MGGEGSGAEGSVNLIQHVDAVQCFSGASLSWAGNLSR